MADSGLNRAAANRRAPVGPPALPPGYEPSDAERRLPEQHHGPRTDFARDRARLLHSSALRRLAAKTQVLSPASALSFARTRLTHSLEVAQIGRELAVEVGADPDVVDAACLAHDLGHPPFGHNGERALDDWAKQIGGFEGNAQTFRLLTRLEPKRISPDGTPFGLNLTRASLDASTKYPWTAAQALDRPHPTRKFGVYVEDLPTFRWMRTHARGERTAVEAQLMDLADDIAYSVHDFEDAIVNRYIDPALLAHPAGHDDLIEAVAAWDTGSWTADDLGAALERLRRLQLWVVRYDESRAHQAQLKDLTSQLIGRFTGAATAATLAAAVGPITRYHASVVVPPTVAAEIAVLKAIVGAFVMNAEARQPMYAQQRVLLAALCDSLLAGAPASLDPVFAADWDAAIDDGARRRVIVDQVASLTDQAAQARHAELAGR